MVLLERALNMDTVKGWKTSEFWVTILTMIGTVVNQSGLLKFTLPVDQVQQVVAAAAAYVGSRSVLKAAVAYASAKVASAKIEPAGAGNR